VCVWRFDPHGRSVSHLLSCPRTFRAQGIEFVSFSGQLDTSTPAGKMVFTVLGAVAELERSLIVERVKAGLRNATAKGKRLGRPQIVVDVPKVAALREQGRSWPQIAKQLGIRVGTAYRAHRELPETPTWKPFENPQFHRRGCGLNRLGLRASRSSRQAFDKEMIFEELMKSKVITAGKANRILSDWPTAISGFASLSHTRRRLHDSKNRQDRVLQIRHLHACAGHTTGVVAIDRYEVTPSFRKRRSNGNQI